MALLEIRHVTRKFRVKKRKESYQLMAVNDVSFDIDKGVCVGLVGESGCGKSTLGQLIVGLLDLSEGEILFHGMPLKPIDGRKSSKRTHHNSKIQLIFQDSYEAVDPRYTAAQIVEEPLKNLTDLSPQERQARVDALLGQVGISPAERDKFGMEFSGGQLQRICIARALASNPDMLILDEPLSSLDVSVQAQILNLLRDIKEAQGLSYLLISHDLEAVYYLADHLIVMYGGQIMEKIEDISLFNYMKHPYTRRLLSASLADSGLKEETQPAEEIYMDFGVQKEGYTGCPYYGRCPYAIDHCRTHRPRLQELHKGHYVACHAIWHPEQHPAPQSINKERTVAR